MRNVRKLLAIVLGIALLISALSVTAFAADTGTEGNPQIVEYSSMFLGYLMNDKLEAGDTDGIWYTMTAHKAGIMYVEIHGPSDVDFELEVTVGGHTSLASESNPVITYPVSEGDVITVHKYVRPDASGKIAAASINACGIIVAGTQDETVNMIGTQIQIPVVSGGSVVLRENNNRVQLYGHSLIVSGPAAAIKKTVIIFDNVAYTDVDCDGQIELPLPGNYESRPPITITNNSNKNAVYTFNIVDGAEEGEPPAKPDLLPGDINGDDNINNDDVVLLLWHTLFPNEYPLSVSGDLTGEGDVNNEDVVLLLWHTLFPDEYPLT